MAITNDTLRRRAIALFVFAIVAFLGALAAAAFAVYAARTSDEAAVDATPSDLVEGPITIDEGTLVWLRGMRDRDRPVTLADRTLYPTLEDPRVMVDCSADGCAGALIGRVETFDAGEPVPLGWPVGVESRVRVVVVGEMGAYVRTWMVAITTVSVAGFVCAIASAILGALVLSRARSRG